MAIDVMTADVLDIFEVIEDALANAGYKILDGDSSSVIIRDSENDMDFEIKVTEIPC